jgi:hypothetical protein
MPNRDTIAERQQVWSLFAGAARAEALQCEDIAFGRQQQSDVEAASPSGVESFGKPRREAAGRSIRAQLHASAQSHSAIGPCDRRMFCLPKVLF